MASLTLSNYQLGDLLGRGASGSVYRALNFLTGETVAIKSVSLLTLPASSLPDIMSEIDLLKNLNHPNIVKYKGFARDKESLFIVLEYCENGSLQTILKKFGKFPESLVAVYISQVLEGLIYLHEQGVVHRDIKGANILTNKDGSVKLADFGVSSRAAATSVEDVDNEVVGSPYWMAPEVIEQSGASTASDIWSVGCVVMELLEGKPPYGDLAPMQALWRIVQDESMRVPEGASPVITSSGFKLALNVNQVVKDFLYHCFQKDPNLRVSAKKLLRHPWMLSTRRALDTSAVPGRSAARTLSPTKPTATPGTPRRITQFSAGKQGEKLRSQATLAKKPVTVYDQVVQRVQEWNEALNASPKAVNTVRRLPPASSTSHKSSYAPSDPSERSHAPLNALGFQPLPASSSADSLSAEPPTSTNPSPVQPVVGGLMQQKIHKNAVLTRAREQNGETWDDDFASDITFSKPLHRRDDLENEDSNQATLRPTKSPVTPMRPLFTTKSDPPALRTVSESNVEDYSDLVTEEDDGGLATKLANLKMHNKARRGILHPDDLRKGKTLAPKSDFAKPPPPIRSISTPIKAPSLPMAPPLLIPRSPASFTVPKSPRQPTRSPPGSKPSSLRSRQELSESQRELQKYSEAEDEDYSDMFESQSLQLTRRSNRSFRDEEEENDPFAEIEDDFTGDANDLEANLLRDKRATLCANISKAVELLQPNPPGYLLKQACDDLLSMLQTATGMNLEAHFISSRGMLAVLEMLESRLTREIAFRLLRIVNTIVINDVDALESFCLVGGIPVIIPYTSKKHSSETRLEASTFIQQLIRSPLTLQMFISCRGLRVLVELLDEDYLVNKSLILSSLEGVASVFDLQSPTPRNDFCRMFVREGILDPLSTALLAILKDAEITDGEHSTRAINALLLFCQVAQADSRVREAFAHRTIMIRLLKACESLSRQLLVTAIKAIKHLSTSPQLIEILQNSNAMEVLVSLLGKNVKGSHSNEICSQIFQTIYSMTRLSKARQEEAASSGIIPLLKKVIQNKSPLKQFALPILCDLANAGKVSRRLLWQNDGIKLYLDLLEDPYWRVSALDAILAWMADETARVEDVLLEKPAAEILVNCFVQASGVSFEGVLDPFLKILRLSTSLTAAISSTPFFRRLSESLEKQAKAVVKLNLLRLIRVVCDNHPERATLVSRFDLARIVDRLAKQDDAILVRELAKEIYPSLLFGTTEPSIPPTSQATRPAPSQVPNTYRQITSETAIHDMNGSPGPRKGFVTPLAPALEEEKRHKRKISRSQLKDVCWQADESARLGRLGRQPCLTSLEREGKTV